MNTEIFVVTKKGENKYFNEVFNFTGTIQECDDFALLNNFGGGVEEVDLDEGVCKNCDQLTPRSDLREYRRDIYFCSRCLEDYTLESQEGGTK